MARPRSIYERFTKDVLPPPEFREGRHQVIQGESLISIANLEYSLEEYDPDRWRGVGLLNGVTNPFTFEQSFLGAIIRIPVPSLPDFQ